MKRINIVLAVAGGSLFIVVATRIGWANLLPQLQAIGVGMVILVGFGLLRLLLQTHAWSSALRADGIRVRTFNLIGIRMAAQSMGYLTVLGPLVSEPMRISLLRKYKGKGTNATLVDAGVYGFSSGLFGIADCVCAGAVMAHSHNLAGLAVLAALLLAGIYLIAQPRPLLSSLARQMGCRCPTWLNKSEKIESEVRQFGSRHESSVRRMFWCDLACQVLLAGEVAGVLWCLRLPFHTLTILALDAANRVVKMLAGWVPARIGADETGTVAAFAALGLPSASGLALALARRSRDLLVCILGFGWLAWEARFAKSYSDGSLSETAQDGQTTVQMLPAN